MAEAQRRGHPAGLPHPATEGFVKDNKGVSWKSEEREHGNPARAFDWPNALCTGHGFQCSDYLTADYADLADKTENTFQHPLHPRDLRVIDV